MAIAFDAKSNNSDAGTNSLVWAHTCAGDNRLLVVGVSHYDWSTTLSVTYDGDPMTSIASEQDDTDDDYKCELFYLINPSAGTHNVVVTLSESEEVIGGAVSLEGVDQVDPVLGFDTDKAGAGAVSCTVDTTGTDGCWGVDIVINGAALNAIGGTQTLSFEDETQANIAGGMTYSGPKTPAGNLNHTWDFDAPFGWCCYVMAAFKPYVEVGTNIQINKTDAWKDVAEIWINIGNVWKRVVKIQQNIGDLWKNVFG